MTRPKAPRGTSDLLPPDSEILSELEANARTMFDRFGYRRIETPIFESTDVFQRAAGEASDVVLKKEMYTFNDRSDRSLTLRPEGTAGIARAFVEHDVAKKEQLPVRLFLMGWFFRYERPQKGRTRQFHQIDAEVLGSAEPTIDAELIALASQLLETTGLQPQLYLNSMGCAADRERYYPVLREALGEKIEDMCDDCQVRLEKNPLRVFDCKVPQCKKILRGDVPPVTEFLCEDCRTHYDTVQRILESVGVTWKNDPHLVRGFDYYTRTVFEFILEDFGARGTICAGGRYDGLVELLGGASTPAVGWAIGAEPVMVALREREVRPTWEPDVYVIWLEGVAEIAMAASLDLRRAGLRVVMSDAPKSMKAQMRAADKAGAKKIVILGPGEVERRVATVKDLSTGEQREVPLDALSVALSAPGGGLNE